MPDIPSSNLILTTSRPAVNTLLIEIPSANLALSTFAPTLARTGISLISVPSANLALSTSAPPTRQVVPWTGPNNNPTLLCPHNIVVRLSSETVSPSGRSLTGKKQFVQADAGYWVITLERIRIRSNLDILEWRRIEGGLNGRTNVALIPIPNENATISATANASVVRGATTVFINATGDPPLEGMFFSVGPRLYCIREVLDGVGPVYEVRVRPPIREAFSIGSPLNFSSPQLICRLARDDGMNIVHSLMIHSTPNVDFIEDWVI